MKIQFLFFVAALFTCLSSMPGGRVAAQTFTNLHNFSTASTDGKNPYAGVILSGKQLFGTTGQGGAFENGTVFSANSDGTGFTVLHSFKTNEGYYPLAGLVLDGSRLYGTTISGGSNDNGSVFAIHTNGTGFTVLHHFAASSEAPDIFNSPTNNEGAAPRDLTLVGNVLYGVASGAGRSGNGTIFKLNTNGTGFTVVHHFAPVFSGFPKTNSEGSTPIGALRFSGNTLYGATVQGGSAANGALFAVNTDGTGFTNLHHFTQVSSGTNGDGIYPDGGLVLSGNTLFGMASQGGHAGNGVIFAVKTNGTGFTNLHHFTKSPGFPFSVTNTDGINPLGGLLLSGNALFGKTTSGGSKGSGVIFGLNLDGTGFSTLFSFAAPPPSGTTNATGYNGRGPLIRLDNTLYGTASEGGTLGFGTLFGLTLPTPPTLSIARSGTNAVLRWPTNRTGFTLQFTTNLIASAWNNIATVPTIVGGQNSVTNPVLGQPKFYRLSTPSSNP